MHILFKDTGKTLYIKDVYYIPELGINLLSIKLQKNTITIFDTDNKEVKLLNKQDYKLLTRGEMINGLFYLLTLIIPPKGQTSEVLMAHNN